MRKKTAIDMLGGTPKKAAEAMGYKAVQTVYLWPDPLPEATADRVRGAAYRLQMRHARVAGQPAAAGARGEGSA